MNCKVYLWFHSGRFIPFKCIGSLKNILITVVQLKKVSFQRMRMYVLFVLMYGIGVEGLDVTSEWTWRSNVAVVTY